MKTHHNKPRAKTRPGLLPLVLGLALLSPSGAARADDLLVNTFDADVSGIGWQNWRSYVLGHELLWDGTQDADENIGTSGSMHIRVDWPTTDHPTYSSGWNDVQVAFNSPIGAFTNSDYLEVEAFIKIDVTNSSTAVNGKYGAMEVILNGGDGGWRGVGYTTIQATNGWQRIHGPLPGDPGNTFSQLVLMFVSNGGDAQTNTVNFWVDNLRLIGPPSVNTNRPALSIAKAPPAGLTCIATATGDAWQRQMVRTVNNSYSWHTATGASTNTTYAITVADIPGGAQSGFEAMMYLIPENGMSNPDGGSVDWDSANVAYFTITANANGTGKGNFRYKVNSAGAENFLSWTDHNCATGPLGTWQLAFNNDTNVTITAPDGTSTSLTIPDTDAANFQGGLIAYFGDRPASTARIGLSATFSRIKITGAAATIDDTFVSSGSPYVLDPATWVKKASSPTGIFITAPDAKYWLTWPLPDNGYTNLYATDNLNKKVANGEWAGLPVDATGWLNVAGAGRLTIVNQSALNAAFSYAPTNCFFGLFHPYLNSPLGAGLAGALPQNCASDSKSMKKHFVALLTLAVAAGSVAEPTTTANTSRLLASSSTNACWWAGVINHGDQMPLAEGYKADLRGDTYGNQAQPLLLSSQGDVIWSEDAFAFQLSPQGLRVDNNGGQLIQTKSGDSLRDAFQYASRTFFPPSGKLPDKLLFTAPQYNTWIELQYDQNQADILKYAKAIRDNGFAPGVLMIDDNWQQNYGHWDFRKNKFPDAKAMVRTLHTQGFKVMLWMVPFVHADCEAYADLARRGLLLKDASGGVASIKWWNGAGALLDLTHPEAVAWFRSQLDYLQSTYKVDGFKFDAGDSDFYKGTIASRPVSPNTHSELFGKIGLAYPLNEYRAMWKMGGQPLVQRLRDKHHSWDDLQKLVPNMLLTGLMGYPFSCPDMIGGGEYKSFQPGAKIDQELVVRSAQSHALMPMMQFSVAPWRVLDPANLKAVRKAVQLREKHKRYILKLAQQSASTGEPMMCSLEYAFPHQGYERVNDQFLLGDRILVAPVVEKDARGRTVMIPPGKWNGFDGKRYAGPAKVTLPVGFDELCYFEKVD